MDLNSSKTSTRDFTIGDKEDSLQVSKEISAHASPGLEDDDFLLGDSEEEATQTAIVSPDLEPDTETIKVKAPDSLPPTPPAQKSDFASIQDLISEELEEEEGHSDIIELDEEIQPGAVEVQPLETLGDGLEDTFLGFESVRKVLEMAHQEIIPLTQMKQLPKVVKPIFDTLTRNRKELRQQQDQLQQLISQHVHQGEFDKISSLDSLKKKVDDMLLKIRALENRFNASLTEVVNSKANPDIRISKPVTPSFNTLSKSRGKRKAQEKTKAKRKNKQTYAYDPTVRYIPQWVKVAVIFFVFSLTVPAYYISAGWGVKKATQIDVGNYTTVIPLVRASATEKAFNGVISDSWQEISKSERELAIRQLGAMVRVDGFETIFLLYEGHGIAAIYNIPKDKLGLM